MVDKLRFIKQLQNVVGKKYVFTDKLNKEPFSKGWRYGEGSALAVVKPGKLTEMWKTLEICVENDLRELGFGDVSVNKKMKDLNKILYDILLKIYNTKTNSIEIRKI